MLAESEINPYAPTLIKAESAAEARMSLLDLMGFAVRARPAHRHQIVRGRFRRDRICQRRRLATWSGRQVALAAEEVLHGLDILYAFESSDLLHSSEALSRRRSIAAVAWSAGILLYGRCPSPETLPRTTRGRGPALGNCSDARAMANEFELSSMTVRPA